jgi:hypothetical protein
MTYSITPYKVVSGSNRSEVVVYNGNGHGSGATRIRRFSTELRDTGSAITYADSPILGGTFTINEDGIYSIEYTDIGSTAAQVIVIGISVNSTQTTQNIEAINVAHRLSAITGYEEYYAQVANVAYLEKGDIVRAHTNGWPTGSYDAVRFSIMRIA